MPRLLLSPLTASGLTAIIPLFLPSSVLAHNTKEPSDSPCLTSSEAQALATQFVQIFNLNPTGQIPTGTALPSAILSPEYTFIDEGGILCGSNPARFECHVPDRPVFSSREDVVMAVEKTNRAAAVKMIKKEEDEDGNGGENEEQKRGISLYSNFTSTVLHSFASCDEIAVRFESSARTIRGNKAVTVPEGTVVKWKGTVLLKADLQTRMTVRAENSEDGLSFLKQLGALDINELSNG